MHKTITKYRLFNKYNLLSIILMLTILWLSWAFVSNFVEICIMDYSAPDLAISSDAQREEVKYEFIVSILTWERYIDSAMTYTVYIFPLFSLITVLPFCDEMTGYYSYPARFKFETKR